jgi:hypothetical protein
MKKILVWFVTVLIFQEMKMETCKQCSTDQNHSRWTVSGFTEDTKKIRLKPWKIFSTNNLVSRKNNWWPLEKLPVDPAAAPGNRCCSRLPYYIVNALSNQREAPWGDTTQQRGVCVSEATSKRRPNIYMMYYIHVHFWITIPWSKSSKSK